MAKTSPKAQLRNRPGIVGAIGRTLWFVWCHWISATGGSLSMIFAIVALFWPSQGGVFVALAFSALLLSALNIAYRSGELLRPKIETECGETVEGSRGTNIGVVSLRIAITSLSETPITNCQAYLTEIRKGDEIVWGGNSVNLTFCPPGHNSPKIVILYPDARSYVDVVYVHEDGSMFSGAMREDWNFEKAFDQVFVYFGEYFMTVKIVGDMPTKEVPLIFKWTGDWETSSLTQIEPDLSCDCDYFPR